MNTIWSPDAIEAGKPKYKAVVTMIRDQIAVGGLQIGEKLPPVRELAWQLNMNNTWAAQCGLTPMASAITAS